MPTKTTTTDADGRMTGTLIALFLLVFLTREAIGGEIEVRSFEDVTVAAGLDAMQGYHAAWGDFDNDGVVDLHEYKHVWRNVRGMFKCVAVLGGVGVWGDYDNDGYSISSVPVIENCTATSVAPRSRTKARNCRYFRSGVPGRPPGPTSTPMDFWTFT